MGPEQLLLATLLLRPNTGLKPSGVPSPFHHRSQGPGKCRQGLASPQEGHAGSARAHHRPQRGPRRPHIRSVFLVFRGGVTSPPQGAAGTERARRKGVLAQASGPSRLSQSSSRGRAIPQLSPQAQLTRPWLGSAADHCRGPVHGSNEPQGRPGSSPVARRAIRFPSPLRWCRISRTWRGALAVCFRHARRLGHAPGAGRILA
ncbi:hypothetical protein NDU88_002062 [Pleurodeles waltl]|uniref:Uncharacterized protein n=1 Tax=Pleurodeles waltl TaxID=8319 RepID=A0AAV7SED2_PLEWA|nr:hypothetical protein NDU88_002062 [Pleurodeles waltl]